MSIQKNNIGNGVMLNAYPDSIGKNLHDIVNMLKMSEFKDAFSFFYVLPTFFNSDLDRGFSIIDYNLNKELVSKEDLEDLSKLDIMLKFDIVLNHLSVESPQFKDLSQNGNQSIYKDFFINWNEFWEGQGSIGNDGVIIPKEEFLSKLFMRKSGLPVLKVLFPDGTEKPYWNTFYQEVKYNKISPEDLKNLKDLTAEQVISICEKINHAIEQNHNFNSLNLDDCNQHKEEIFQIVNKKRSYLGQMDVNAKSEIVWDFYEETLKKVSSYGCKILRLDAFAYLHKEIGQSNFFNRPGTWDYLEKLSQMAEKYNLVLLPEIHAEYGLHLHEEVAGKGYYIYDFFLPGLTIHTLENKSNKALIAWAREILDKGYKTVNMLGCHDGIPVLDLKGKEVNGSYNKGLLEDTEIKSIMNKIMERGGRVKNLYDPSGKKISYYQVNATFFSALGESEQKLLLARAIQMFMPGIPQVWYLDLFAGKNDYIAANRGGNSSHKEINRTTLTMNNVEEGLKKDIVINQLTLIRLRNTSKAFHGAVKFNQCLDSEIDITWSNRNEKIQLKANLKTYKFSIRIIKGNLVETIAF